jgi:hypothetical protein
VVGVVQERMVQCWEWEEAWEGGQRGVGERSRTTLLLLLPRPRPEQRAVAVAVAGSGGGAFALAVAECAHLHLIGRTWDYVACSPRRHQNAL